MFDRMIPEHQSNDREKLDKYEGWIALCLYFSHKQLLFSWRYVADELMKGKRQHHNK